MSGLARRLAGELIRSGVRHAFGITGSGISYDLIACLEDSGVPFYPVAHEAAAALMAGACCRDGRLRAAAIGIKGPGLANFIPGILSNRYEGRPALTVSESYSSAAPAYYMHKRADHAALCGPVAKGYARLDRELRSVGLLAELAVQEAPGPVHLDISDEPEREPQIRTHPDGESGLPHREDGGRAFERILEAVERSRKPAVVLGSMAARRLGSIRWDRLGVPVLATAAAKGCIDERSAFFGGLVTGEAGKLSPERNILQEADLIVGIGLRNTEVVRPIRAEAEIVIVDNAGHELSEGFQASAVAHPFDMEAAGEELARALSAKSWGEELLRRYWREVDRELFREAWLPARALRDVQERLHGKETILVSDTGLFCTIAETVWKARQPSEYCGSGNGRFMGTSVPTAIGLAVSHPEAAIVCLAGDGGIRPYWAELRLAAELRLKLFVLYMSDGGYGSIRRAAASRAGSGKPVEIAGSSWYRPMKAIGWEAVRVRSYREFRRALERADLDFPGPLFMEMAFDKTGYTSMTANLR
jgi:acetolactate synthase-1/2/3 large subunit